MGILENNIANLRVLGDGWDGRGSAAPASKALETASSIGCRALGSGGVQLEIHAGGSSVEIEIDPDGQVVAVSWSKH